MVKTLKKSELARALSLNPGVINMAIKRGYMCEDDEGLIEMDHPLNKLWLKRQIEENGKTLDLNKAFDTSQTKLKSIQKRNAKKKPKTNGSTVKTQTPTPPDTEQDKALEELRDIQIKIKEANLKKTLKAIELDEIKIAKQRGQLIPFDAVKSFFLYTVEGVIKQYDQESKSVADVMLSRFGATREEHIETKKELSNKLNEIKIEAIENLLLGLDQIVEEYQEVRGRGESK